MIVLSDCLNVQICHAFLIAISVFLVADGDVRVVIELAVPPQLALMTVRVLHFHAAIRVEDIATARLRVNDVVHRSVEHLFTPVVVIN